MSVFFVCIVFCAVASGMQSEVDRCVSKLEKRYETMNDFQAAFSQETHSGSMKMVQKGAGVVYFKKGGKMRWEYTAPEKQQIILDGKNLWVYQPEDKQVLKNNFNIVPTHIVVDLFRGRIDIQEKFKVSFIQQEVDKGKAVVVLALIPVIYNPTVTKLTLWINPETDLIEKSSLEDEFGNRTDLHFHGLKTDKGIDDSVFAFVPPPGVEIFEPPPMQMPQ